MECEPFSNPAQALQFIRAGNARVTVRSLASNMRYTFRVRAAPDSKPTDPRRAFFVELLKGRDNSRDYSYIGMIKEQQFFTTKATQHLKEAAYVRAFKFVYGYLSQRNVMPPNTEVWHESACGRCGRPLTTPDSISRGIGPECIKYMGAD